LNKILFNLSIFSDPSSDTQKWTMNSEEFPFKHLEINLPIPQENFNYSIKEAANFWDKITEEFPEWDVIMGKPGRNHSGNSAGTNKWGHSAMLAIGWMAIFLIEFIINNI
jgi:hypothetical protein